MWTRIWLRWALACVVGYAAAMVVPLGYAGCLVESATSRDPADLVLHLSPDCSESERGDRAVQGEAIVDVLAKGHSVDLVGVVVHGPLDFDRLVPTSQTGSSPPQGAGQESSGQRLVQGALAIRNSVVSGPLRHEPTVSQLRFEELVDFQGTRFMEGVDLSRSVFRGLVELSRASFEKEAFFVQGEFVRGLGCRETM